jgi:hydroxymethylbilane synthase
MTTITKNRTLTIGTRGSKLALIQTQIVQSALEAAYPDLKVDVLPITTRGDVVLDRPLSAIGGKGLFIAEIEDALRRGDIDVAVHSAKDLPTEMPDDMALAAFPLRADPRDAVVSRDGLRLDQIPTGACVGTGSARRASQLRHLRPDLILADLRGNVDTRLRKLQEGQYDAIILAAAGLERMGLADRIAEYLEPDIMLPAVAQGAIAVEIRANDVATLALFSAIDDAATRVAVTTERAFLAALGGGCSVPVGGYARLTGDKLRLMGMIGSGDGRVVRGMLSGPSKEPALLGRRLARRLLSRGGQELLAAGQASVDED